MDRTGAIAAPARRVAPPSAITPIPERPILVFEEYQLARRDVRASRRDSCSSISASSPMASGSGSSSTRSRPSRIASPERSCRVSVAPDVAE